MDNPRLVKSLSEKMGLLSAVQTPDLWSFKVRGQSNSVYEQQLSGKTYSCTCEDHQGKKTFCKHLLFLVARVAKQFELAADMAQRPKTTWKPKTFDACVASWMQRLLYMIKPEQVSEHLADKEGMCSICYEEIGSEPDNVSCQTTCKQWFHKGCMDRWLEHSSTCPLCRANWKTESVSISELEEKIQGVILTDHKVEVKETKTDLVISFDTTGSMYPCLAEVRRHVATMSERLFREIPSLRIAVIAHGDYCDKEKVITTLDFTDDQPLIKNFVENAPSTGGGDYPECYELVLRTTKTLSWRPDATMKSLILIGDAPPHEKNENPEKIDWRVEAEALVNRNIQVFSVQCLNNGNHEAFDFYSEVARITNGYHIFLDQFSYIKDMIQAICFKQYNDDHLEQFQEEIQRGAGGMSNAMRLMFDTMLGKKTREQVRAEMHPDRFRERYHRPSAATHRSTPSLHMEAATPSLVRESELRPCAPTKFQVFTVDEDSGIKEFCAKMGIRFSKGRGFYEFTKNEIIQPQKEIVLMERATGELFEGEVARTIAGIGTDKAKMKPGHLEKYRIFIQSTSPSRKLIAGQGFLYEVEM